jgi:hypothetical protein
MDGNYVIFATVATICGSGRMDSTETHGLSVGENLVKTRLHSA